MREEIQVYLRKLSGIADLEIEVPPKEDMGDYSTAIALSMAKEQKIKPREIALKLKDKIENADKNAMFSKIEIAGAGFINFFINDDVLQKGLRQIIEKGGEFGHTNSGKGKKVIVEYVSANPTGPLHIGHGRWAALGDTISNILKMTGCEVFREFYVNDIGKQTDLLVESVIAAQNNGPTPEGGYGGSYIKEIAKEFSGMSTEDLRASVINRIIDEQKKTLASAGVEYDGWFFEHTLHENGSVMKAVEELKKHNAAYEKDGAVWFRSEQFGDDKDRVLVRETGEPTYFAADTAYHRDKFKRGFDLLINVWGTDHHGYVKRLQSALEALKLPSHKLEIIIGQLVTLYRGKEPVRMSKRTGEMVTLKEVIDEIGPDATRFFMLLTSADSHMDFDLELAKSKSMDNPVYYVQYAHARICNILASADASDKDHAGADTGLLKDRSERDLIIKLLDFPEEIDQCAVSLEPHHLVRYARELASLFHSYYHKCRVISDDKNISKARLALVQSTRIVISNVLKLLGVSSPERM